MTDSDYFIFFSPPCHRICFSWLVKQSLINWPGGTRGRIQSFFLYISQNVFDNSLCTLHYPGTACWQSRVCCSSTTASALRSAQFYHEQLNQHATPLLVKVSEKCLPSNHLMLPCLPNRWCTREMKRRPGRLSVFNTRLPHTAALAVISNAGSDSDRKASVIEMTLAHDSLCMTSKNREFREMEKTYFISLSLFLFICSPPMHYSQ